MIHQTMTQNIYFFMKINMTRDFFISRKNIYIISTNQVIFYMKVNFIRKNN